MGTIEKKGNRINPKQVDKYYVDGDNNMLLTINFLPFLMSFIVFMIEVIDIPFCRDIYLLNFEKNQQQVIKSGYSYLKPTRYYMCHYDNTKKSKRRNCSLKILDLLNVTIIEELYDSCLKAFSKEKNLNTFEQHLTNSFELLAFSYKYSKELMLLKIMMDIDKIIGCDILSQEIFYFIGKGKVTHNLTVKNKTDLNGLIDRMVNTNPIYHRLKHHLPFFNRILA